MKKLIFLIIPVLIFLNYNTTAQCNSQLHDKCYVEIKGTTYLKDFKVRLQTAEKNKKSPIAKYSIAFSKGNHYRFTVCCDVNKDSEAIIQIYQSNRLIGSNFVKGSDKIYSAFDFVCNKTGIYSIMISYRDGKDGCSVTMLSLVQ